MSHKQVLVWRKDLNCRKGKIAAQIAHASLAAVLSLSENSQYEAEHKQYVKLEMDERVRGWLIGNFKKVCVYVNSEEELLALHQKAESLGIINALITDSGLTEFNGVPTNTCIAVGPDFDEKVDQVTGGLPLL